MGNEALELVYGMNKILITGGTGLVGSAFPDNCIKISSLKADLRNKEDTWRIFEEIRPDTVIHCAAKVGGVQANMDQPATFCRDNILMNQNVLEASRVFEVKKFVGFLSTCIFPDGLDVLTEDNIHDGPPHDSNFAYAYAKRMLETQVRAYNRQYHTRYFCVIPCNVYGPRDHFDLRTSHVVPALMRKCLEAHQTGDKMQVWGTGQPKREFLFSEDAAAIVMRLIEEYEGTEPVIISPGREHSIAELVQMIAGVIGYQGEIEWDASKPDGQYRKRSDNTRLKSVLSDLKFTSLEDGLKKMLEWYQDSLT